MFGVVPTGNLEPLTRQPANHLIVGASGRSPGRIWCTRARLVRSGAPIASRNSCSPPPTCAVVLPVQRYSVGRRPIEPVEQSRERGLARSGRSDYRQGLSRLDLYSHVVNQHVACDDARQLLDFELQSPFRSIRTRPPFGTHGLLILNDLPKEGAQPRARTHSPGCVGESSVCDDVVRPGTAVDVVKSSASPARGGTIFSIFAKLPQQQSTQNRDEISI